MTNWYDPYTVSGLWYRGNTHLHTFHGPDDSIRTEPATIIDWYRSKGYHFLNLSDHNHITHVKKSYDDFIVFSGHESDCVVAIDVDNRTNMCDAKSSERLKKMQYWVDDTVSRGGIAQIAHPKATLVDWRRNLHYFLDLSGVSLIELYNHRQGDYYGSINWRNKNKYGVQIWDALLLAGKWIWPTAVDDSHDYLNRPMICSTEDTTRTWRKIEDPKETFFESGGGWMVVLAEQFTARNLKSAIRRGSVYASQGPSFKTIGIRSGKLIAEADEYCTIRLILDGESFFEKKGFKLNLNLPCCECHKYMRVELVNRMGKSAWSAPFIVY